jgi:hypothetical protein
LKGYHRQEDQEVTIYLSNTGYISAAADTPSSTFFAGLLISGYSFEQMVVNEGGLGGGSGESGLSYGEIEIALADDIRIVSNGTGNLLRFNPQVLTEFDFRARPSGLVIKTSDDNTVAYSTFTTVFTGTVDTWSASRDVLTLIPSGRDLELAKPLDSNFYKGIGGAIRFNYDGGTGDRVEVSDAAQLDQQTTFTVECIAKRTGDSGNSTQYILHKNDLWALEMDTSGNLTAWHVTSDNTKHILTSTHVLSGTDWEQITVRWKSTESNSDMLIDGEDVSATYSTGSLTQSLTEAEIDIAQVRLWSDVHTDDEVIDNLWLLMDGTEGGLAGSWAVNEGTGSTTADDANSNTGTLTGASWIHSLEGDDYNIQGDIKPITVGQCLNRPAILVDELRLIYDVADGGFDKIHNVYANRDGIDLDTTVGTSGDTTDLFTNSPAVAKFIFDSSTGRIKLGTDYGDNAVITADVQVGVTGSLKPASVFEDFITTWAAGFTSSDFVTTGNTVAAHNALMPTNASAAVGFGLEENDALSHLDSFMLPLASIWSFNRSGKIFVAQLEPPNSVSTDHTLTAPEIAISDCELLYEIPPSKRIRFGYDKFWYVHSASEVSATAASTSPKLFVRLQKEFIHHPVRVPDSRDTNYPGALSRTIDGYAVYEYESGTSVNRNQTWRPILNKLRFLLRDDRRVVRIPLARQPDPDDEFNLADIVTLDLSDMDNPMFDITSAQNWIVVGMSQSDTQTSLILWG